MTVPPSFDPFRFWARVRPDHTALVDAASDRRWSYAQFDREIDRWSGWLAAQGVGPGDRVGALSRNRIELVSLIWACGRLGAMIAPFNWRLAPAELGAIVARYRPGLLVGETTFRAGELTAVEAWRDLDREVVPAVQASRVAAPFHAPSPDDPWIVLFTSGTTGLPKGAILPHRQIFYNALSTALGWGLGGDEVVPVTTPFFHTGGLNVLAIPVWQRGGTVVLVPGFDADQYLEVLERERCTISFAVPTQYVMLVEQPRWARRIGVVRQMISGGAACPPALAQQIAAPGYSFKEGFGLTEFGPNCFSGSDAALEGESGVVGHPMPMVAARLVDDAGADVPAGETGELLLRGPMAFAGYLDDPVRTDETLVDGWVRTGDLFLQDRRQRFVVRGRRKEMFISGAENIFPAEIEAALAAHPSVVEVGVVGVPDPRWGEVGRAFVVARDPVLTEADLVGWLNQRLARYKVPKSIVFLDALPRLGSGKCDRAALTRWEVMV